MASDPVRTLVIANPRGQFTQLLAKVAAIQKKYGAFGALFILGDFFAGPEKTDELAKEEEDLLSRRIKAPLPVYFFLPGRTLPLSAQKLVDAHKEEGAPTELVPNLFYLGKSGVTNVAGLRVAFCGGTWNPTAWSNSFDTDANAKNTDAVSDELVPHITHQSVQRLLSDPSFVAIPAPGSSASHNGSREPQTLAEARRLAAANVEAADASSRASDAERARPSVDLLLTNAWPSNVTLFTRVPLPHPTARSWGCPPLAQLARMGKPRYFFSLGPGEGNEDQSARIAGLEGSEGDAVRANGVWWEREPYENFTSAREPQYPTRFISVANFVNSEKKKWFMAVALHPAVFLPSKEAARPANVTENPFAVAKGTKRSADGPSAGINGEQGSNYRFQKRTRTTGQLPPEGYKCKVCGSTEHFIRDCPTRAEERQERRAALTAVAPQDCWFCLSNPKSANHLIAHIAEESYLALPKGQLPRADADEVGGADVGVPGGGHVLAIPIAHVPSLYAPGIEGALREELERYRAAVTRMYAAYSAVPFAWELGRTSHTRAGHMQIQMVPVCESRAQGLAQALCDAARDHGWEFLKGQSARRFLLLDMPEEGEPTAEPDYVRIDVGNEVFAMNVGRTRFPLAFPRTFLAEWLSVPERADWKVCAHSEAIERAETEEFKDAFQEWAGELDG